MQATFVPPCKTLARMTDLSLTNHFSGYPVSGHLEEVLVTPGEVLLAVRSPPGCVLCLVHVMVVVCIIPAAHTLLDNMSFKCPGFWHIRQEHAFCWPSIHFSLLCHALVVICIIAAARSLPAGC